MIHNKRVIVVIPARSGSKSILNKNITFIAGKPLLAWSILSAQKCNYIDRIIVSTDGENIAEVAREFNAEVYMRPENLSQDDSLVIDALRDLIKRLKDEGEIAEYLVLLEPTSPLRAVKDIDKCIEMVESENFDSVATFSEAELNPHRAWKIKNNRVFPFIDGAIPWLPRQKLPPAIQLNGAVYVFSINELPENGVSLLFGNIGAVNIPSDRAIDIDQPVQLAFAETLLKERLNDKTL